MGATAAEVLKGALDKQTDDQRETRRTIVDAAEAALVAGAKIHELTDLLHKQGADGLDETETEQLGVAAAEADAAVEATQTDLAVELEQDAD